MKLPTTDKGSVSRPFLVQFAVSLAPAPVGNLRYDDGRMMLMSGDVPAILADVLIVNDMTINTAIRQETTDDR